jgi:hypothetical protein
MRLFSSRQLINEPICFNPFLPKYLLFYGGNWEKAFKKQHTAKWLVTIA